MTDIVPADQIEQIVGVERHATRHYARAVSAEQTVYILHSARCRATTPDLRDCGFSQVLDNGIDLDDWQGHEDKAIRVVIGRRGDVLRLIPAAPGMRFAR